MYAFAVPSTKQHPARAPLIIVQVNRGRGQYRLRSASSPTSLLNSGFGVGSFGVGSFGVGPFDEKGDLYQPYPWEGRVRDCDQR